jgi:hypothetical protein
MLEALETEELIVGAYTDREGRMCPMLAAHRRGVRSGVGAFPRAWDAFARATRPRMASQRELEVLRAVLEESLVDQALEEAAAPDGESPRQEPGVVASAPSR